MERFIDFHLSESFDLTKTNYGTNFPELDNGKFTYKGTYFNIGEQIVFVSIVKLDNKLVYFKFLTSVKNDSLDDNNFKAGDNYSYQNANALTIFNKALFVLFEFLKKNQNFEELRFEGASDDLKRVYRTIIKNKRVLSKFENYGWVYDISEEDVHIFKKINNE